MASEPDSPLPPSLGSTRISSGSLELDEILGGGLDPQRTYLFEGSPGTGKTTLAMQFLLEGVRNGESGLYITLSETEREMQAVAASHGWALDGITIFELIPPETSLDPGQELTVLHPAELELAETTKLVFDRVKALDPVRVVFDSLSELRLLAQSALRYRRQVLAMKNFFASRRCTVIMLDDLATRDVELQLHSLAHGVLLLEQAAIDYGAVRRRLRVVKMRGIDFRTGYHDYEIRRSGLVVYPRLVAADHTLPFADETVPSGNAQFDAMLGGALVRGTNLLLLGSTGVGKSSLALSYGLAAAGRGERAMVFAFDENLSIIMARAHGLGLPLQQALDSGLVAVRQIDPAMVSPGEFAHMVRHAVEQDGARVVVIDSLNGYLNAMPEERFLVLQMHELLTYLNQQGVLTILILAQTGLDSPRQTPLDLSYLSDTVVLLRYFEADGCVRRAISVVKKRTGDHANSIHEYDLTSHGIVFGEKLRGFAGLLQGAPHYSGPTALLPGAHEDA